MDLDYEEEYPEICICAAVKTNTGKVFRGHRHSDCFKAMAVRHLAPSDKPEDQGFITSRNRYVDRAEGYKLQMEAGIESASKEYSSAEKGYCQKGQLYSEDLY